MSERSAARQRRPGPDQRACICRRGRSRTDTPLTGHRLLRPARLPFRHSPSARIAPPGARGRVAAASSWACLRCGRLETLTRLAHALRERRSVGVEETLGELAAGADRGGLQEVRQQAARNTHEVAVAPLRRRRLEVLRELPLERAADPVAVCPEAVRGSVSTSSGSIDFGRPASGPKIARRARRRTRLGPPRSRKAAPAAAPPTFAGSRRIRAGMSTAARAEASRRTSSSSSPSRAARTSVRAASVGAPTRSSPSWSRWSWPGRSAP